MLTLLGKKGVRGVLILKRAWIPQYTCQQHLKRSSMCPACNTIRSAAHQIRTGTSLPFREASLSQSPTHSTCTFGYVIVLASNRRQLPAQTRRPLSLHAPTQQLHYTSRLIMNTCRLINDTCRLKNTLSVFRDKFEQARSAYQTPACSCLETTGSKVWHHVAKMPSSPIEHG